MLNIPSSDAAQDCQDLDAQDHGELLARDRGHLIHSLHSAAEQEQAHVWVSGHGAVLIDDAGREFLDALAGLWNVIVGHGRAELGEAAARQMSQLGFASSYAGSTNRPSIELAERLAGLSYPSVQKFFFTSGGAEANETAFKTARYFWKLQGKPEKYKVISRQWAYHGTTLAAMSATGIASYWPMFEPRTPGFLHIGSPYPYRFSTPPRDAQDQRTPGERAADLLEEMILREGADTVAAFIGEPVQGAGGVIVPPDDYWPRIRQICDRHNVLLITDEVITAFGRSGDWFSLTKYGVEPDMFTFAKGITSGYFPFGGVGVSGRIADAIHAAGDAQKWMHAFTYSGHPVGCAVALANLDILEREGLIERARESGAYLLRGLKSLESHPHVGEVRGQGFMAAIEIVADKPTKAPFPADFKAGVRVHNATRQRGMFTRLRGDVFNLAPCYVTSAAQLDRMVSILGESLDAGLGHAT
jgi:adenosylmethionine-8-amino-7-oxononanoate aminotransferase